MQIATVLNKKFSSRKLYMIAAAVGVPLLLAGIIAAFFLIQGTVTQAEDPAPDAVQAQSPSGTEAQISFSTADISTPVVYYGKSVDQFTDSEIGNFDQTNHTVILTNLEPETKYYYYIKIGNTEFNNEGLYWTFTTGPADGEESITEDPLPSVDISPSEEVSETPTPEEEGIIGTTTPPMPSPLASTTITPPLTLTPTISGTPSPSTTTTITPTPNPANVCKSNNCVSIIGYLGTQCTTQDYLRCIQNVNITITQQPPTNTPTPSPIPAALRSSCAIDYVQSNSCTSLTWDDMSVKPQACSDAFTQYFVQCKSTNWESNDAATWYCNDIVTSNQLTLPCGTAPTPPPGQAVFCRVRAEAELGGADNATDWVYAQTSCPRISGDDPNCSIDYIQANTCTSWIWDFDYQKDPRCAPSFDRYFFQCTDDGNFNSSSFWYCNSTLTDHYTELPCNNVGIPGDGMPITCRVRAEDGYGEDSHASSWATASTVCPTSTPTPSPTPVL